MNAAENHFVASGVRAGNQNGSYCVIRTGIVALIIGAATCSTAQAQADWVASIQGGYSVSTSTAASFPAGGSFASSAFIGRELGSLVTLGVEGGFYGVENTTTEQQVDCPPPSLPGSLGCVETDRSELDWIQLGGTVRIGPTSGRFRPYGAVGAAAYFGSRDVEVTITGPNGELNPVSPSVSRTAIGGSVGGGAEWSLGTNDWSLGLAARVHFLVGGDENGEFGGDTFVTLLAGVGYRW
jgi:hypothetical protein